MEKVDAIKYCLQRRGKRERERERSSELRGNVTKLPVADRNREISPGRKAKERAVRER
ncbi:hypothetical protein WH47_05682 [Habropoda laboriosa]|uniref:Uncharacterized protein n=1 Tax=Habropoda laboriosa TaxID=597456 RepID=A0A0L7QQR7_9HYME|nr:hypothetical protein WH47_05682 [Habropoda laboriosa]